jgi:uncharacterized oxidoreductase
MLLQLKSNTILITGGGSGIGLALAEHFLQAGNEVILCGRQESKLHQIQRKYSQLKVHTKVCDLAVESERRKLFDWCAQNFPQLNVLINNAGIQRRYAVDKLESWSLSREEIAINLEAPIHLCNLFIPALQKQANPVIANVTSGLSFFPLAANPIYSATKAALHSFTLSLRHQLTLAKSPIEVIEIIPPAVNTDLGGVGLHDFGVPLAEFAQSVMKDLGNGSQEICYGMSVKAAVASRQELHQLFLQVNGERN